MIIRIIVGVFLGGVIGAGMGYFGKCSSGACPLTANPLRGTAYGVCMGALFAFLSGGISSGSAEIVPEEVRKAGSQLVVTITSEEEFQAKVIESDKPVLVDMYASWCGPCKALAPIVEKLAYDFNDQAVIAKLNVENVPGPPNQYGVSSIPAVFIFHRGKVTAKFLGFNTSDVYAEELIKALNNKE